MDGARAEAAIAKARGRWSVEEGAIQPHPTVLSPTGEGAEGAVNRPGPQEACAGRIYA